MFTLGLLELALACIGLVLHPVAVALLGVMGELPATVRRALGFEPPVLAALFASLFPLHLHEVGVAVGLLVVEPVLFTVSGGLTSVEGGLIPIELFLLLTAVASFVHRFALL